MSDDRLLSALRRLGEQELPLATDRKIRGRLETAWTSRTRYVARSPFSLRGFVPVLGAFILILGLGGSALGASADSPLWDARVALESVAAYLRLSGGDRVAYLLDLVQTRTEEAARQEAAGNPGAAAKARAAASAAVVELNGNIPHSETALPMPELPAASPSATPPPANSPSPSPSRSASDVPAAQLPASGPPTATRTSAPTVAPTPVRTEPLHTPTPTPAASTKLAVTITGTVHDSAGSPVTGACITTSPTIPTSTTSCITKTTNGSYGFSVPVTPGQTITLYAYVTNSTGGTLAGSATTTVTAPITVMPAISLTLRR